MGITDDTTSVPEGGDVCGHIRRRRVILVRSARAAGNPAPTPRPKEKRGLREVSLQGAQDRGGAGSARSISSVKFIKT